MCVVSRHALPCQWIRTLLSLEGSTVFKYQQEICFSLKYEYQYVTTCCQYGLHLKLKRAVPLIGETLQPIPKMREESGFLASSSFFLSSVIVMWLMVVNIYSSSFTFLWLACFCLDFALSNRSKLIFNNFCKANSTILRTVTYLRQHRSLNPRMFIFYLLHLLLLPVCISHYFSTVPFCTAD